MSASDNMGVLDDYGEEEKKGGSPAAYVSPNQKTSTLTEIIVAGGKYQTSY